MKGKFRLKDKTKIAWDPDTNITWTGEKVIESEVTVFVAKCITKSVLVEVKEKGVPTALEEKKETKEEKIERLKGVVEEKIKEADAATNEVDFDKKVEELKQAEKDLKEAEAAKK